LHCRRGQGQIEGDPGRASRLTGPSGPGLASAAPQHRVALFPGPGARPRASRRSGPQTPNQRATVQVPGQVLRAWDGLGASTVWYSHRRYGNGLAQVETTVPGCSRNSRSGSLNTWPRTGPPQAPPGPVDHDSPAAPDAPGTASRTATDLTASMPPTIAPEPGPGGKLCSKHAREIFVLARKPHTPARAPETGPSCAGTAPVPANGRRRAESPGWLSLRCRHWVRRLTSGWCWLEPGRSYVLGGHWPPGVAPRAPAFMPGDIT